MRAELFSRAQREAWQDNQGEFAPERSLHGLKRGRPPKSRPASKTFAVVRSQV